MEMNLLRAEFANQPYQLSVTRSTINGSTVTEREVDRGEKGERKEKLNHEWEH